MFSNDLTGYNCDQVVALRDTINSTAQRASADIVETLHSQIIVPMSTIWYAPEAIEFFEGFATTVKASGENITAAFDAFRAAVESAGRNWADNTGGNAPVLSAIDSVELNLSISEIQRDNGGSVVIDENRANSLAGSLPDVEHNIKANLESLASNLNAETAFLGRGQAEALQSCFVRVSGEIHKIFKYLTDGEESLQGQINKAIAKYGQVSEDISNAFNNAGN